MDLFGFTPYPYSNRESIWIKPFSTHPSYLTDLIQTKKTVILHHRIAEFTL